MRREYSLEFMRPTPVHDLIRLGRDHDGGYVVSRRSIESADVVVGLGISTDWSFEAACLDLNSRARLVAVDGSVSANRLLRYGVQNILSSVIHLTRGDGSDAIRAVQRGLREIDVSTDFRRFFSRPGRVFVNEMIGSDERADCLSWTRLREKHADVFRPEARLFLKVDIEGSEYRVLQDVARDASQVTGLVVEFHDCDLMYERLVELIDLLREAFAIVHVHGNNFDGVARDSRLPRALEVSFVRRSILDANEITTARSLTYPVDGLDQPNDPRRPDFALMF